MSEIQGYEYDFDKSYVDYELSDDSINLVPPELIAVDDDLSVIEEGKDLVSENGSLDNESEDSLLKEIYVGQTFVSFDMLEQCLKRYSTRIGFETKIVRAEKENNIFIRKTYKCRHSGKYLPKKKLDPMQNQDRESGHIECEFTMNASYQKHMNLVFVNKFTEDHNHVLNKEELHLQFSLSLRKVPDNIKEEFRFYVQECQLGATVLKRILQNKFPDQEIYNRDLYNMICKYRAEAQIKNDASTLYEYLSKVQQENPDWYFKRCLWARFYDVIINDNTCKMNKYMMPLSIFIVIDSNNRSRIAATAVVSDETVSTYKWILKQTKLATNGLQPTIIFTDADPAMQVAITNEYPEAIVRHLSDFDRRWMELMNNYSEVQSYCDRVLYSTKEFANSGSSLCQLQAGIDLRLKDEIKYAKLQEFRNMNPTTGLPHVFNTIFKKINDMCVKYLTPNSLALQRKQILESLLYRSLLHNNELNVSASQQLDHKVGFIEDDYEEPQILLNMALEDCSDSLIPFRWYSEEGIALFDKDQELTIQLVQSKSKSLPTVTFETLKRICGQEVNSKIAVESDSKKVSYSCGLGICKKALNIAIMNNTNKVLEDLLQHFINEQVLAQSSSTASNLSEQGIG
ncbi:14525_t:CDS:2 [Cetraspora pellucida]|uniref:14525_t:CDS:1 n=1 Tax=Cetraspora pellucida TaxID=1433469 RepID=A0A9N9FSB0_9GLOM|nr:14525_t:CDS:2 [Cetraspora pellucida]